MYLSDIFTIPVNLAGLPAIAIPVDKRQATSDMKQGIRDKKQGLPVGFQLIGKHWHENVILGIGEMYENE